MTSSSAATPVVNKAILWPHRLVFSFKHGRWITSLLLFSVMASFFYILGTISRVEAIAVPAYFCLVVAYIIPASHYINDQTVTAFEGLKPILDLSDAKLEQIRSSLLSVPVRMQLQVLGIGIFAGGLHIYILLSATGDTPGVLSIHDARDRTLMAATVLIWVLLTTTISFLIRNVSIFARLARENTRVNLLDISSLSGFARISVYSTLLLVGALASFPVLLMEADTNYLAVLPGFLAITIPMIFIFLVPLLPLRKRIKDQKKLELNSIQDAINQLITEGENLSSNSEKLNTLQPLLEYRREINLVPEWPFDSPAIFRLFFYLIIPPLTWVGAALIERLVDTVNF